MTRDEALYRVKGYLTDIIPIEDYSEVEEIIKALEQEPKTDITDKIKTEIEQVKAIMNEEILEHDRKDLINFINGINQCLVIIDKYRK